MSYTIDIVGDEALYRNLDSLKSKLSPQSRQPVMMDVAKAIERRIKSKAPTFTGKLKRSYTVKRLASDDYVIGPFGGSTGGYRFSPNVYAQYVEGGGGPVGRMPNVEDIALRMNIPIGQAFAFAKYLRDSGKAVQHGARFVESAADWANTYAVKIFESKIAQAIRM